MTSLLILMCLSAPDGGEFCVNITNPDWVMSEELCEVDKVFRLSQVVEHFQNNVINMHPGSFVSSAEATCVSWED